MMEYEGCMENGNSECQDKFIKAVPLEVKSVWEKIFLNCQELSHAKSII